MQRKKKFNIWLIFVLGTARYEFEYDQILTLLSMHFSFAFFSRAPLLQTLQHYYMSIYIYMPIQGIPMMGMKGM